jgi:uncharacterized protein (TIGR02444 family)
MLPHHFVGRIPKQVQFHPMADAADMSAQGSPFWRFSLAFYRRPGVGEACIQLQDGCAVDVNLLLFLLWLASAKRRLSADEVRAVDDKARGWRELTVLPLRAMRRTLKGNAPLVEAGLAEAYRSRIKGVELEAERLQQEALYALAESTSLGVPDALSPDAAARANIAAYQAVLGREFPAAPVALLLGAFKVGVQV